MSKANLMKMSIHELESIVDTYHRKFTDIGEADFSAKPFANKWSKKEVLGHLIDSAQNNLRRFICAQYEENPFITYQQDFWVKSNGYQYMPKDDLLALWRLLNLRICAVLGNMPPEAYERQCNTGSPHTLEWLAADYVKHMKHHINQIISGSFHVMYP